MSGAHTGRGGVVSEVVITFVGGCRTIMGWDRHPFAVEDGCRVKSVWRRR